MKDTLIQLCPRNCSCIISYFRMAPPRREIAADRIR